MSGFFLVTDVPARRIVQYKRVTSGDGAVFVDDESELGTSVDVMPYIDKTGISASNIGTLYEVQYLPDAGDVYFSEQPISASGNADNVVLTVKANAGTKPYAYQWYKDDKQVVNVPESDASLTVTESGKYWCVVTDAAGVQAVSEAGSIEFTE